MTVADVEAHWVPHFGRALRRHGIPARVASRVPGVTREMAYEMDLEVRELLTELARNGYPAPVVEEVSNATRTFNYSEDARLTLDELSEWSETPADELLELERRASFRATRTADSRS